MSTPKRKRRRTPNKAEAMGQAVGRMSQALTTAYRHPFVYADDLKRILAAVAILHLPITVTVKADFTEPA